MLYTVYDEYDVLGFRCQEVHRWQTQTLKVFIWLNTLTSSPMLCCQNKMPCAVRSKREYEPMCRRWIYSVVISTDRERKKLKPKCWVKRRSKGGETGRWASIEHWVFRWQETVYWVVELSYVWDGWCNVRNVQKRHSSIVTALLWRALDAPERHICVHAHLEGLGLSRFSNIQITKSKLLN